jgi:cell division protein FtsI (penicillin-binding protein 3)
MHNSVSSARITHLFFCFCLGFGIIMINLFSLQTRDALFFAELGQQQYTKTITRSPERSHIIDRNNILLAGNCMSFAAYIVPHRLQDAQAVHQFLHSQFPSAYERLQRSQHKKFMYVQRNLSAEQIAALADGPRDIRLLKEPHRHYPCPFLASVIGITDIDNHGIMGIEYSCDAQLRGSKQRYHILKDAHAGHFYCQPLESTPTDTSSTHVQLTLDAHLHYLVAEQLRATIEQFGARQGAVIILDPHNGEILVMANYPTFDPEHLERLDLGHTKNYSISEQYELGSVMKVFTALAALEEGVIDLAERIDCMSDKQAYIEGRRINTTQAHGELTLSQIIEKSNNIGIAQVALRLQSKLYTHLQRVGFGKKTGIELPGEQSGFINPPERWSKQSLFSLSYGYEVSATLLQLAQAFALIANNGIMVAPHIRMDTVSPPSEKLYSDEAIAQIQEILKRTTLHGTAYRARMRGYDIKCKTGTANLLIDGVYREDRNCFTCAGIVQKDAYKRVIVTHVQDAATPGLFASQVAVPLFEKVAQKMLIHERIM